ncbi:hypothetical protein LCGC14_2910550, partial [marine sediment metagenome]
MSYIVSKELDVLSSAKTWYIPMPVNCRVIAAIAATETAVATGASAITLSDGTTDIGVITIALSGSAAGDVDAIVMDSTSLGKVLLGPTTPLKISCDATPSAGKAHIT